MDHRQCRHLQAKAGRVEDDKTNRQHAEIRVDPLGGVVETAQPSRWRTIVAVEWLRHRAVPAGPQRFYPRAGSASLRQIYYRDE